MWKRIMGYLRITKRKVRGEQFELFSGEPGYARNTDPHTSHDAAHHVDTAKLEGLVLDVLKKSPGGLTTLQISEALHMRRDTISPRLAPLKRKHLVKDSGKRRAYKSNRKSIVWQATTPMMNP
jgi:hypothetical protein